MNKDSIVVKLESGYRAELGHTCAAVADEHLYAQAMADVWVCSSSD